MGWASFDLHLKFPDTFTSWAASLCFSGFAITVICRRTFFPELKFRWSRYRAVHGPERPEMEQLVTTYSQYSMSTMLPASDHGGADPQRHLGEKAISSPDVNITAISRSWQPRMRFAPP